MAEAKEDNQEFRLRLLERRWEEVDELLEKLTYVLYGMALGVIICIIIDA